MGRLTNGFLEAHRFTGDVLIETGTYNGRGMLLCAPHFKELHTIELDPERYEYSRKRVARATNVTCHLGHSPEILRSLLNSYVVGKPKITDRKTVIWLDAHYVATDPAAHHVAGQCPLLAELDVIFCPQWKEKPTILIDDARMFKAAFWKSKKSAGYDQDQWPTEDRIAEEASRFSYRMYQLQDVFVLE